LRIAGFMRFAAMLAKLAIASGYAIASDNGIIVDRY